MNVSKIFTNNDIYFLEVVSDKIVINDNYNGIIYAPNGIVTISANDVCISGTIIAKKVIVYGNDVTFK